MRMLKTDTIVLYHNPRCSKSPIAIRGGRAVIGRPPQKILELL